MHLNEVLYKYFFYRKTRRNNRNPFTLKMPTKKNKNNVRIKKDGTMNTQSDLLIEIQLKE